MSFCLCVPFILADLATNGFTLNNRLHGYCNISRNLKDASVSEIEK